MNFLYLFVFLPPGNKSFKGPGSPYQAIRDPSEMLRRQRQRLREEEVICGQNSVFKKPVYPFFRIKREIWGEIV